MRLSRWRSLVIVLGAILAALVGSGAADWRATIYDDITGYASAAGEALATYDSHGSRFDNMPRSADLGGSVTRVEAPRGRGARAHTTISSSIRSGVATNTVGSGSGPWMEGIAATRGGAVAQSRGGSCVSACGSMLSSGARTEAQLLDELGEWSNPGALADALGSGWLGHYFASSADALTAAGRGPMGAVAGARRITTHGGDLSA